MSSIKIDGVKAFTYREMAVATNSFDDSTEVGQGGYGKVYKGILADGVVVAIKRAQEGSLQGEKEFLTEIKLLSRLHHRNLVSLIGYCDEEGEQVLFLILNLYIHVLYVFNTYSKFQANWLLFSIRFVNSSFMHNFNIQKLEI